MNRSLGLLRAVRRRSSFANVANEHYAEFLEGRRATLGKRKAYVHQADHPERPITFYYADTMRQLLEMAGPEQVSAHYESFWISRRYALGSIMLATGALMLQKVTDLNWVLRTWVAHIGMYAAIGIFFYEVPKYMFLPLLNNFYMLTMVNEMKMMQNAVPERVQALVDRNMREALGQFDFLILHRKFNAVKQESIRSFLATQELELKQGVRERAADLLRLAEEMETNNQKQLVGKVVASLQADVEQMLRSPPKEVVDAAFDSALTGIREGRMTYQGDRAAEFILRRIRAEAAKFKSLSEEQ